MRTAMTLRNKIILKRLEDSSGHSSEKSITAEKEVYGSVSLPSLTFRVSNESAGKEVDLIVHLWRREFEADAFNYAEVDGTLYRISGVGSSANDLFVKLSLERGL